ncbi:MAG: hypothetical protein ACKV2T_37045 [Kofleriaceae bacterium]
MWMLVLVGVVTSACSAAVGQGDVDAGTGENGTDAPGQDTPPGEDAAVTPPPDCATVTPAGWQRRVATTNPAQSAPTTFEMVHWLSPPSNRWNPFPNGGAPGKIATDHGEYIAIVFTTPADVGDWVGRAPNQRAAWVESQVDGEATLSSVYVTISRCAGDFRVPPVDSLAPANDPTFAPGCTSRRRVAAGFNPAPLTSVRYAIGTGPSNADACMLGPNQTYYLNFIRADVSGGSVRSPTAEIVPGFASNCNTVDPARTFCGVQLTVD